jgi:predicted enzyme related to lactoylglutathione lyase
MRRLRAVLLALVAASGWAGAARADVTVMAVRLGASDVSALAKFYETAFGLKEIDRVGNPVTEIIMRYGATVAAAKSGSSPEFLVQQRPAGESAGSMHHAIFRVSDIAAAVAAAKAAGAKVESDTVTVPIGGTPIKIAMLVDPQGNALELMELPTDLTHLPH